MSLVSVQTREMAARMRPKPAPDFADAKDDPFLDWWLPKAAPYIDANWRPGADAKPSSILAMRYCALMTSG